MATLMKVCGLVAAILGSQQAANATAAAVDTHALTPQCAWVQRPWARLLALDSVNMDQRSRAARSACWARRGLKSPTPLVKIILPRWPSEEEVASHAHPLPAPEAPNV